jgi:plasmid maintenance system antidote protein VapI
MSLSHRTSNAQLADTIKVLADDLDAMTKDRNSLREMYLRELAYRMEIQKNPMSRLILVGMIMRCFPYGYTGEIAKRLDITERHAGRLIKEARDEDLAPTLAELK